MAEEKSKPIFKSTFSYKLIYVFTIPDEKHEGCLKIGDATLDTDLQPDKLAPNCHELNQAALERIKEYTNTAAVDVVLLHTELALATWQENEKFITKSFRDHDVHRVLKNSGIKSKKFEDSTGNEWFEIGLDTAKEAISAVKHQITSLDPTKASEDFVPIVFRPEQKEAITKTVAQFKKSSRMLWNAKMRFGKTLSALEVVKRCKFKKTILITHRPVVDEGWHEDFAKIFTKEDNYVYGSKKNGATISALEKSGKNYIYFASIQDLRGSKEAGGKFDKNNEVFNIKWNLVIIDEAHEGTTTKLGDEVKSLLFKEKKGTKLLELSGTPFNILENYEDENSVYTWDYVMEQKAKREWEETHFGDSNPYADLPEMNMFTYDLGKLLHEKYEDFEDKAFNFSEFFRTNEEGTFVHEEDVNSFLNLLTKESEESLYPFSNENYRKLFRHSFWIVPGVKEALALQHLLEHHLVFQAFEIVNVAGNGDPEDPTGEALEKVKKAISDAGEDGYTITLSCGKLTTGVSVPEWTAVFMLSGSYTTKAAGYLQTIFRVQTPCNKFGKVKTQCYVFDFAPDRTLKMVADSVTLSAKAGKTKAEDKIRLGEFLNYCPVIGIEGSTMKPYQVNGLLQELKSAYAERAVTKGFDDASLYNDELLKLTEVELKQFKDLQGIIGETKANNAGGKIDVNAQGLTEEEYEELEKPKPKPEKHELTPEEEAQRQKLQEAKKMRQTAISVLRGISIRMPLLIYGADVAVDEEISLEKFVEMVDETSWQEFMPRGVTKERFKEFTKYYDEDVFIAAGKRIRNLVLNADKLSVTERVRKIAEIFSYFRNPDKETVLTPWRVVNMHLGDCLGGYSFFDKNYEKPLAENEEPHLIHIENVTDKTLENPDAKILEINSKTGLYPLYCAYSIFRAKKAKATNNAMSFSRQQMSFPRLTRESSDETDCRVKPDNDNSKTDESLWNETIEENIFVICKTPMAKAITRRTLSGYGNAKINAHAFDDLVNQLKSKSENFISKVTSKNFWGKGQNSMQEKRHSELVSESTDEMLSEGAKQQVQHDTKNNNKDDKMEFDAIVGNPPYNINDGGGGQGASASPVYNYFIETAKKINPAFVSMISPSKWLFGGKGLDNFREHMLSDERLCYIHDFLDAKDCFPSVAIAGGVCYFLWDRNHNGDCLITSTINGRTTSSTRPLRENDCDVFIRYTEGISVLHSVHSKNEKSFSDLVSIRNPYCFATNFRGKKTGEIKCYDSESFGFVEEQNIKGDKSLLNDYKVFVSYANGNAIKKIPYSVISVPFVGKPREICTDTYLQIGPFQNLDETKAVCAYMKTKFFRFLVCLKKGSPVASKSVYQFVPLQDFTANSDIDWAKSIPEIDAQLYKKYNLSAEEISFIEKMIRPME